VLIGDVGTARPDGHRTLRRVGADPRAEFYPIRPTRSVSGAPRRSLDYTPQRVETIFASVGHFVAVCAVLVAAQMVYVTLGFGAGLVAVGGLALVLPEVRDAVVLLLLLNIPAELWVVATSWRRIRWRGVAFVVVGLLVGIPVGAGVLRVGDASALLDALGWLLVVVGLGFLALPSELALHPPRWAATGIGLVSGLLTGLFGTGGPPLIVWYRIQGLDKTAFRGTLMALFLIMTAVRVPSYVALGLVTEPRLWSSLAVLPAVLLGAWVGHHIHLGLPERLFRHLVSIGLAALGVVLLVR
jgi:uncharacterized membrane protein YfcA